MASDIKLISRKRADKIVDDLLNKYPKGPRGLLKKEHYSIDSVWHWSSKRYTKEVVLPEDLWCAYKNAKSFGYGDDVLAMVHYHINEAGGMRQYLRDRDKSCGKVAITRRTNRLDRRVTKTNSRFVEASGRGIYKVRNSSDVNLYVISNSPETAKFLAKTMLATSGIESTSHMYAKKITVASTEILKKYNDESYKSALRRTQSLAKNIERQKAQIVALNHLAESIIDFGDIQPDMLSEKG